MIEEKLRLLGFKQVIAERLKVRQLRVRGKLAKLANVAAIV